MSILTTKAIRGSESALSANRSTIGHMADPLAQLVADSLASESSEDVSWMTTAEDWTTRLERGKGRAPRLKPAFTSPPHHRSAIEAPSYLLGGSPALELVQKSPLAGHRRTLPGGLSTPSHASSAPSSVHEEMDEPLIDLAQKVSSE